MEKRNAERQRTYLRGWYQRSKERVKARRAALLASLPPEEVERRRVAQQERGRAWRKANPRHPDGVPSRTPKYVSGYVKKYRQSLKGQQILRDSALAFKLRRRALLDAEKSKPCIDCLHAFPPVVMDFDHRNPEEKLFSISANFRTNERLLREEIAKCDVVCANCHRIREGRRRAGLPVIVPVPEYEI